MNISGGGFAMYFYDSYKYLLEIHKEPGPVFFVRGNSRYVLVRSLNLKTSAYWTCLCLFKTG